MCLQIYSFLCRAFTVFSRHKQAYRYHFALDPHIYCPHTTQLHFKRIITSPDTIKGLSLLIQRTVALTHYTAGNVALRCWQNSCLDLQNADCKNILLSSILYTFIGDAQFQEVKIPVSNPDWLVAVVLRVLVLFVL